MAGYCGFSKSWNAIEAEKTGKLPLTKAVKAVAEDAGCSKKSAREALESVGPCEWHHTSKFYNRTDYYSVDAAVDYLRCRTFVDVLESLGYEDRIGEAVERGGMSVHARGIEIQAVLNAIEFITGIRAETIRKCYYETWGEEEDEV